eukprot:2169604-Prymnesium_polylepis.1
MRHAQSSALRKPPVSPPKRSISSLALATAVCPCRGAGTGARGATSRFQCAAPHRASIASAQRSACIVPPPPQPEQTS